MHKVGKFNVHIDSKTISIDSFPFAPAEADKLKSIVSFAGGMRKFKALPARVGDHPFEVQFGKQGDLSVVRTGGTGKGISLTFGDVDDFLHAVDVAISASKDERLLRPQPRAVGKVGGGYPDVFEGKS